MTPAAPPLTHPSPNAGERRDGAVPRFVVLHYTAMPSAGEALTRLCDPTAEVSAHYLIAADGALSVLVPEERRAWHAGAGSWAGCADVNSASIGIELDNDGASPFAEPLMRSLLDLLPGILARWGIAPEGVIGHSDMAPGRKSDPGPHFDWPRLAARGLARRPATGPGPAVGGAELFRRLAHAAGYTADVSDERLLEAVRLRYRPEAAGPLAPADFAPLAEFARS